MNNCTKYGFNNLIISGSYGGHRRHTMDDGRRTTDAGRRTTPWVWHKLPTGELIKSNRLIIFWGKDSVLVVISTRPGAQGQGKEPYK